MTLKSNMPSFLNNSQFRSRYDSNDGGKTSLTAHVPNAREHSRSQWRVRVSEGSHATQELQGTEPHACTEE